MLEKTCTLLFLVKGDQILLAMKKRGFGAGRYNGVGGKVQPSETLKQALVRECQEEIDVTPTKFYKVAEHDFTQTENSAPWRMYVHAYICTEWEGEPSETEEMAPEWFKTSEIPYDRMWHGDILWIPAVLEGLGVIGSFAFDVNDHVISYDIHTTALPLTPQKATPQLPTSGQILTLASQLLVPAATIFRTTKLQPELDRFENDAEHSFLLATLACAIAKKVDERLDLGKISQYALIHDLVEVYAGDTTIWASPELHATKHERETHALTKITKQFGHTFPWIDITIKQYEAMKDPESCFVYALDKIIPYIVMAAVDHQPFPPNRSLYEEKMDIARKKIALYPKLLTLFEELDADYKTRPHFFAEEG